MKEAEQGPYFAPGTEATHPNGVMYQGDYQHEGDGTAIAIRLHARALAKTGVPLFLKPFSGQVLTKKGIYEPLHLAGLSPLVDQETEGLRQTSIAKLYPVIRHFVAHKTSDIAKHVMRGSVGPLDDPELVMKARQIVYGSTVFYSVWERSKIPIATAKEMSRMGDNWVPCTQNKEMLHICGVKNVCVIPHPFDPESPLCHLTKRKPIKTKRFYNIGRWEPRKNQVELVRSFLFAFNPGDDVHLTLKTHGSWPGYETLEEVLSPEFLSAAGWTRSQVDAQLTVIEGILRPDQIVKLHYENNIYVSTSCGEAWCLPAFEAKVAGNVVLHVPYGGTSDFCDSRDGEIPYKMAPVPPSYGWDIDCEWAEASLGGVESALREMEPLDFVRTKEFEERFSLDAVGAQMRARLKEVFGSKKGGEYL